MASSVRAALAADCSTPEQFSHHLDGILDQARQTGYLRRPHRSARGGDTRRPKERLRLRLYGGMLALDASSVAAAFLLANFLRFGNPLSRAGTDLIVAILPIYVALAFSGQAYSLHALNSPKKGVSKASRAFVMAAAAVIGVIFYAKAGAQFSRLVFATGTLAALVFISVGRYLLGRWAGSRYQWSFMNEVLLVDGAPAAPSKEQMVVHAGEAGLSPSVNDPHTFDRLGEILQHCDRVVLSCVPERRASWSRVLKGAGIDVEVLTPELDHLGAIRLRQSEGQSRIVIASGPLGLRDRILKRSLDLLIAVPVLIVSAPLVALACLAIKLESRGPMFFRQQRVGRTNRIFHILKLRTMRTESADHGGTLSAHRQDERVTRVGRFLRKTSLDELPQLFNVVFGDMSLVGPRPHALASTAESALFWNIDSRYWERGAVKPGITGLAQIRGYRGATETREDLTKRLQADLEYLTDWTIWRDLGIILKTARVLVHRNAF